MLWLVKKPNNNDPVALTDQDLCQETTSSSGTNKTSRSPSKNDGTNEDFELIADEDDHELNFSSRKRKSKKNKVTQPTKRRTKVKLTISGKKSKKIAKKAGIYKPGTAYENKYFDGIKQFVPDDHPLLERRKKGILRQNFSSLTLLPIPTTVAK